MKVKEKFGILFIGKKTLAEFLLRGLMKRKLAFDKAFKARRFKGKLTSMAETEAYIKLGETIVLADDAVRVAKERLRLFSMSHAELVAHFYGEAVRRRN